MGRPAVLVGILHRVLAPIDRGQHQAGLAPGGVGGRAAADAHGQPAGAALGVPVLHDVALGAAGADAEPEARRSFAGRRPSSNAVVAGGAGYPLSRAGVPWQGALPYRRLGFVVVAAERSIR